MMSQVPWESWQQWHHVRCSFFSNSPHQIAQALDRVSAWQTRGGLPVAVEITAELISLHQRDPSINTEVSPCVALPGEMLRMMYAMAIMRLVNGVVDQSVRRNTSSVANRAEDARLPRVFVDIRHETSHNELPSLPLVRHASKQALAWLERNYWEEQEQLLPDTQGTLKTKLVEHAQVVFEILVSQQKLLGKEVKEQDYKQQRLMLEHALKGIKRQQQALLRELLELTHSGTSELVPLLVKQGLLVHDLNPSCSSPVPSDECLDNQSNSDFDEAPDSPPSKDDIGISLRQKDYSVSAWKHTCVQLAEHMPQLPSLLLSSIFGTLTAISSESNPKMGPKEDLGTPFSKEELVEWASWILDQSFARSKKKKAHTASPKFIEAGADVQMQAVFPQDTLKELAHMCLRSRLDKESLVKVISRLSPLISDSSYRRRVELLARCSLSRSNEGSAKDPEVDSEIEESGRNFVVSQPESDSIPNDADGELSLDTTFLKARELQQMSMAKYLASLKASECANSMKFPVTAGPWSKAKNWSPCAIGMLPSIGNEAVIPQFDLKQKTSTSVEVGHTGRGSEPAGGDHSVETRLSAVFSEQGNGQDFKRKAFEAQAQVTPGVDPKRMRVVDQLMSEEANIDEKLLVSVDESRGMECDGERTEPMDEDQSLVDDGGIVEDDADIFDGTMDCTMELKPIIGSKAEEVTVTWQGYLLQGGVSQLGVLQELPNLQAAIRVL